MAPQLAQLPQLAQVVQVLLAVTLAPQLLEAATHAPPPWASLSLRPRREVEAAAGAQLAQAQLAQLQRVAQEVRRALPSDLVRQQLQRLRDLSQRHLQSWSPVQPVQPQLPSAPSTPSVPSAPPTPSAPSVPSAPSAPSAPAAPDLTTPPPPGSAPVVLTAGRLRELPEPEADDTEVGQPPSACVWAIVTCCQPQTVGVRYSCFDLLGCKGAFWDGSPCEPAVAGAALRAASKYYGRSPAPAPAPDTAPDTE